MRILLFNLLLLICVMQLVHSQQFLNQGLYNGSAHHKNNHFREKRFDWQGIWEGVRQRSRKFASKLIPKPLNKLVENAKEGEDENKMKERGKLDSLGRDLIREFADGIEAIKNKLGVRSTKNMDWGSSSNLQAFQNSLKAIYPGTKWCGTGNVAEDYDDLGRKAEEDNCCRTHDNCKMLIPSRQSRYGLINTGLFTRSYCSCDNEFYNCLKEVNSSTARRIGYTYFNILGPQCFQEACCENEKEECPACEKGVITYKWKDNQEF